MVAVERSRTTTAEALRARRGDVLARWRARVLADPAVPRAPHLTEPELRDHVPALFDRIVDLLTLNGDADRGAREMGRSSAALAHAFQRLREGYSTAAALRELSHFRCVFFEAFYEEVPRREAAIESILHAAIDEAMTTAAVGMDERLRADLADEHARLQRILEVLPVGVIVAAPNGKLAVLNAAARTIWGNRAHADTREDYGMYEAYWTDDGRRVRPEDWALARVLRGEDERAIGVQEVVITRADGVRRTILNSAAVLRDEHGEIHGGVAVNVDVTEQKETEAALRRVLEERDASLEANRKAREELERDAAFRERFIGVLGHDLRTPLGAVSVGATTLAQADDLTPLQRKILHRIVSSVGRMDRMIRDLLDVTRARHGGGIPIVPQRIAVDEVARGVVEEVELAHPERVLELQVEGDCVAEVDADRIAQVIANLVTNALDHGEEGSAVEVAVRGEEDAVRIDVWNAGPEIPRASIPSLFDPFTRGSQPATSRKRRGLGLGLYIVGEIVRAHGGTIAVESEREAGTRVEVRLPRRRGARGTPTT